MYKLLGIILIIVGINFGIPLLLIAPSPQFREKENVTSSQLLLNGFITLFSFGTGVYFLTKKSAKKTALSDTQQASSLDQSLSTEPITEPNKPITSTDKLEVIAGGIISIFALMFFATGLFLVFDYIRDPTDGSGVILGALPMLVVSVPFLFGYARVVRNYIKKVKG